MRRILFVKTSSLGDVVHNCPAVSDVKRRLPDAQVDWVVEEAFAGLVSLHAGVRRVIPVAIRRWRSEIASSGTWSEFAEFRRAVRADTYDAVIDSQGLVKSALVAVQARGPRHGLDRASAREPLASRLYDHLHAVPAGLHAVERNRRLAGAVLGYTPEKDVAYGLRATGDSPLQVHSPYALLLTMTSRDDKLWPEENWRSLGIALEAKGIRCVLPWGSEAERHRCARIATAIPGALVPRHMSIAELACLVRDAHCVVGVDTGLAHLAAALDTRVVGLYCGSSPALTGLYGAAQFRNVGGPGTPPSLGHALDALRAVGALT